MLMQLRYFPHTSISCKIIHGITLDCWTSLLCILSQPALAWLKVRYYAEVLVCSRTFDGRKYLSLSFRYMAICWLLVDFRIMDGGGGNWPRFPGDFSGRVL
jgi:hypothetical protein